MAIKMRAKKHEERHYHVRADEVFQLQSFEVDGKELSSVSLDPGTDFIARIYPDGSVRLIIGPVWIDGWAKDDLKLLTKGGKVKEVK